MSTRGMLNDYGKMVVRRVWVMWELVEQIVRVLVKGVGAAQGKRVKLRMVGGDHEG